MTLITKVLAIGAFLIGLIGLIALLPSTTDYPLDPSIATSLTIIMGYVSAWTSIFWAINILFGVALLGIGLELILWVAKKVIWIIGWAARLFS